MEDRTLVPDVDPRAFAPAPLPHESINLPPGIASTASMRLAYQSLAAGIRYHQSALAQVPQSRPVRSAEELMQANLGDEFLSLTARRHAWTRVGSENRTLAVFVPEKLPENNA